MPLTPAQWRWPQLGLASALAVMLFLPHLYGLYKVHGDPSWPSYPYARWLANFEFPERLGTPGFPSVEEFARNPYAGPRITYSEYLTQLHTVPALIRGQVKGWVESTVYMSGSITPNLKDLLFLFQASGPSGVSRQLTWWIFIVFGVSIVLTVWGWCVLWWESSYWWVPFLSLWGTWYSAFLYSTRLIEPFRHTSHVYPLLLFCMLWGAYRLACLILGTCRYDDSPQSMAQKCDRRVAGSIRQVQR